MRAARQGLCTRVGTGCLGLVTTLVLLLIWSDGQVNRQVNGTEVTRLSGHCGAAAVLKCQSKTVCIQLIIRIIRITMNGTLLLQFEHN